MPLTPALSRAQTAWLRPLRRSLLVRGTLFSLFSLFSLLFLLLACLGDQRHIPEPSVRGAAVSSEAPRPLEGSDGENLDASARDRLPDQCHEPGPPQALFPQPSPRVPSAAVSALSLTDATSPPVHQPSAAVRRLLPGGGRSALTAICRWRI
ncbi:hypothetical protein [Streptomyces cavernae]|uniref:hypothetical protein n=1 Tax=Streptomyces cavernae TaxID=2259034 RepID=UPI000FEBAB1A|nr:hypothetical protein [Streptomyces cavernae]